MKLDIERRSEIGAMRRQRTLEKILIGTVNALQDCSFESLTIEDVLVAASVSRGTFYAYFDDKTDLSNAIATLMNLVVERTSIRLESPALDTVEKISMGLALYLDFAARVPNMSRVMLMEFLRRSPEHNPFVDDTMTRFAKLLEGGISSGSLNISSLEVVMAAQSGALAFMIGRIIEAPKDQREYLIRSSVFHLLLMLGVKETEAEKNSTQVIARLPLADANSFDQMISELAQQLVSKSLSS